MQMNNNRKNCKKKILCELAERKFDAGIESAFRRGIIAILNNAWRDHTRFKLPEPDAKQNTNDRKQKYLFSSSMNTNSHRVPGWPGRELVNEYTGLELIEPGFPTNNIWKTLKNMKMVIKYLILHYCGVKGTSQHNNSFIKIYYLIFKVYIFILVITSLPVLTWRFKNEDLAANLIPIKFLEFFCEKLGCCSKMRIFKMSSK